jgi:uncharacterized Fe-S cluster-containing radical SAM superfamily protein
MATDPVERAIALRKKLFSDGKILAVDFTDTLQGRDTSRVVELMPIVGTQTYPFRTKVNVKEIDPLASKEYKTTFADTTQMSDADIEAVVRKAEFDFPLWYKHSPGFSMRKITHYNLPFTLQVAGCNFHDGTERGGCWYCFVDDQSNDGEHKPGKTHLGIDETIASMFAAREMVRAQYRESGHDMDLRILRTSGGEPTIVLDWILNLWREASKRNGFVGQIDSNLSTADVVERFEQEGIFEQHTLEKLAEFPVKVLAAIKGVNEQNIQTNVQSTSTMEAQARSLRRFLAAGFDVYPQRYNPDPTALRAYLERMDQEFENFSLRAHLGPLKVYSPTTKRLILEAERRGEDPRQLIDKTKKQWADNYARGCAVIDTYLRERFGVGYKEVTRSDVEMKAR